MSGLIETSAPGKLVILGEYAVLNGGTGVVAAVDRYARVSLRPRPDREVQLRASGLDSASVRGELTATGVRWDADADALPLLRFVLNGLFACGELPATLGGFEAVVDSSDFFLRNQKLGLGSSAAVCVAFADALWRHAGAQAADASRLATLIRLHQTFQEGRGSGMDIAASLLGGVVKFRRDPDTGVPTAEPVVLPAGLSWFCAWTGRSASTPEYLRGVEGWRRRRADEFASHMRRLTSIAAAGVSALKRNKLEPFLNSVQDYAEALGELGLAADLDIFSDAHRALASIAGNTEAIYKPSGAGGGDTGWFFSTDSDLLERLRGEVDSAGYSALPLSIAR